MAVTLRIKNLDKWAEQFDMGLGIRPTIRMGLKITGPAAAYALVWEWGKVDINPGPKTVWGTNPDGERRVLTITAPSGYIRVNMDQYRQFIRDEMVKVSWRNVKIQQLPGVITWALQKAAHRCADLIAATAPYDKGDLRQAIQAVSIVTGEEIPATTDRLSLRLRLPRRAA